MFKLNKIKSLIGVFFTLVTLISVAETIRLDKVTSERKDCEVINSCLLISSSQRKLSINKNEVSSIEIYVNTQSVSEPIELSLENLTLVDGYGNRFPMSAIVKEYAFSNTLSQLSGQRLREGGVYITRGRLHKAPNEIIQPNRESYSVMFVIEFHTEQKLRNIVNSGLYEADVVIKVKQGESA